MTPQEMRDLAACFADTARHLLAEIDQLRFPPGSVKVVAFDKRLHNSRSARSE